MSHNITVKGGTSARLPTAGKYCDRDIIVTAEGGGIELNVVTASALPDTVVDGQIVVITETNPGAVYIDTDGPASPAAGDLWIKMAADASVELMLTEESPYVGGGIAEARQWNGSSWMPMHAYLGVNGAWVQFSSALPPVGTALNDMTWEDISAVAKAGLGPTYFSTGDAKAITINGNVGSTAFSNLTLYAFIVEFGQNQPYAPDNRIYLQIGKSAQTSGKNLCLVNSGYGLGSSSSAQMVMNTAAVNKGGWAGCSIRKNILGNETTPAEPLANSLLAALPSDLREVMQTTTNYTDNIGGGSGTATDITATEDYLWLPAEWEVFGKRTYANTNEQNYQKQYQYYASGNSAAFYKHNAATATAKWWLRSVYKQYADGFCFATESGAASGDAANVVMGLAPCFCV